MITDQVIIAVINNPGMTIYHDKTILWALNPVYMETTCPY